MAIWPRPRPIAEPPPLEVASAASFPARGSRARGVGPALSILLALGLSACYAGRFDGCAAITVFPPWAWLVPGLGLAAGGLRRRGNRRVATVASGWILFLLIFAEEPWSLLRLAVPYGSTWRGEAGVEGEALRVVSLNCDIGNPAAAEEVRGVDPDVILLQESPGAEAIRALAGRTFGAEAGIVVGVDASLIVRGRAVPASLSSSQQAMFVQTRVRLRSGTEIEVICARLVPAVFRLDLWSPDCWHEQAENRRRRREQLRQIALEIDLIPEDTPIILGGDFNAPQGDAVFRVLKPRLHDAFEEAGRGWGNTILNDLPFSRIDQVWASGTIRARRVIARRTIHSDHRMVVCDLAISRAPKPLELVPGRKSGPLP
jgi:vancomycin resistance protein VanJ